MVRSVYALGIIITSEVINIGDDAGFLALCENLNDVIIEDKLFSESLFITSRITQCSIF